MNIYKEYGRSGGRTFFLGDLHGCYDELLIEMKKVDFDKTKDRIFSVGDLVDRGPKSLECLRLLKEGWFFSVLGNHEAMMRDSLAGFYLGGKDMWLMNGGEWYLKLSPEEKKEVTEELIPLINQLPYVIFVDGMTILHAQWDGKSAHDLYGELEGYDLQSIVWGRTKINSANRDIVEDTEYVIVGHTPVSDPLCLGNHIYLDTGCCFGYTLTLVEARDLKLIKKA